MNRYGVIRWRGESLPLTKRGRLIVDICSGVLGAVLIYGLIVLGALLE